MIDDLAPTVPAKPTSTRPPKLRRKWLRWLAVLAVFSVLGTGYQLTRPQELVWWRSQAIEKTGRHVRILIPQGWHLHFQAFPVLDEWQQWEFEPTADSRPRFLRWLLPHSREPGTLSITISESILVHVDSRLRRFDSTSEHKAEKAEISSDGRPLEDVLYVRTNLPAFNRTYKQICNSLTIE